VAGFEVMQTHCLCNTDIFRHVDYFIRLGCLVSILFFVFFLVSGVRFCACGFVQHINRDWTAKTALLAAERSMDFYRGLIYGLLELSELSVLFEFTLTFVRVDVLWS